MPRYGCRKKTGVAGRGRASASPRTMTAKGRAGVREEVVVILVQRAGEPAAAFTLVRLQPRDPIHDPGIGRRDAPFHRTNRTKPVPYRRGRPASAGLSSP